MCAGKDRSVDSAGRLFYSQDMAKKKRKQVMRRRYVGWVNELRTRYAHRLRQNGKLIAYHSVLFFPSAVLLAVFSPLWSGSVPLSFFLIAGWGIGYLTHLYQYVRLLRRLARLGRLSNITREQYVLYREYLDNQSAFGWHRVLFFGIVGVFVTVNLLVSPQFPWSLVFTAGWGIGFIVHAVWYYLRKRHLKKLLADYGLHLKPFGRIVVVKKAPASFTRYYIDAVALRKAIMAAIRDSSRLKIQWQSARPLIDAVTTFVRDLSEQEKTIVSLLETASEQEIAREIDEAGGRDERERSLFWGRRAVVQRRLPVVELHERRRGIERSLRSGVLLLKKVKEETQSGVHTGTDGSPVVHELEEKSREFSLQGKDLHRSLGKLLAQVKRRQ